MDSTSTTRKMGFGAVWMVILKLCVRLLSIISLFIMARLLVPEDYGLVALAMSFYAILDVLTTFNFDMPLIQNQEATKEDYNTAWCLNILMGFFIAIALLIGTYPITILFEEPRLNAIFPCLAVMAILQGFTNIGIVNFRKELDLKKEFYFELTKKIISFLVTVIAGLLLKSYWALILGMLSNSLAGLILSYIMHNYRPSFSLKSWRSLFGFSKWMLFNNILSFANHRLMQLIVGSQLNTRVLGHYSMMKEISDITTIELVMPIQRRALFPGYSKLVEDKSKLNHAFLNSIAMVAFIGVPIAVTFALLNEYFVIILLGDKWLDESWMLKFFCISGAFSLIAGAIASIYYALAKPYIVTAVLLFQALIRVPLFFYFIAQGKMVEALTVILATAILGTIVSLIISCRLLSLSIVWLLSPLLRTCLSVAALSFCVSFLIEWLPLERGFFTNLFSLIVIAFIGIVAYCTCHFSLWHIVSRSNHPTTTIDTIETQQIGAEAILIQLLKPKLLTLLTKVNSYTVRQ